MMERILALQARTSHPVHLAFKNNRAYLGVNYGRPLFEPAIRESTSSAAIHEMAAHFALAEGIVEELDLNTRIWTKGIDASLLDAPDARGPDDVFDLAAKQGTLTPAKLWDAALEASGTAAPSDDAADAVVSPPVGSRIQIDRSPGGTTVHYGLGSGFIVLVAMWVATVALALGAARQLPDALGRPQLQVAVSWIPEVPLVGPLVAHVPVAWFIGSTVLGPVLFLMWTMRVRRVEIAPDAVRIWRGLRPMPRTYARPPYGKIVRVEGAVYVGKTDGLSLINASASPMLKVDEARWVATEMRRAMRDTAR
jgi:hypothetical protein